MDKQILSRIPFSSGAPSDKVNQVKELAVLCVLMPLFGGKDKMRSKLTDMIKCNLISNDSLSVLNKVKSLTQSLSANIEYLEKSYDISKVSE